MPVEPMNLRNGLKAICVVARYIDQLAPYIFAYQKEKDPKIRLGLLSKALTDVVDENTEGVVAFMAYALGIPTSEAGELDFHYVLEVLPEILEVNHFDRLMEAAIKLGLVEPKQGFKLWFIKR